MKREEIVEILKQYIDSKEYMVKSETTKTEYHESIMVPGYTYPASSETTIEIEIDLSTYFNAEEQKEIMTENEIEHNGITYLITYINRKEVA